MTATNLKAWAIIPRERERERESRDDDGMGVACSQRNAVIVFLVDDGSPSHGRMVESCELSELRLTRRSIGSRTD